MRFRRRPIDRTPIDAILLDGNYLFADAEGTAHSVPKDDFERDYAPAHASPRPAKARKSRKPRDGAAT